jgi:hypothetical protein
VHQRVGWRLDHKTANRIRIGELWKRHPELTGRQMIKKLELGREVPLKWVQRIMNDCWRAYTNTTGKRRRAGRTFYNPWRSHALPLKPRSIKARPPSP